MNVEILKEVLGISEEDVEVMMGRVEYELFLKKFERNSLICYEPFFDRCSGDSTCLYSIFQDMIFRCKSFVGYDKYYTRCPSSLRDAFLFRRMGDCVEPAEFKILHDFCIKNNKASIADSVKLAWATCCWKILYSYQGFHDKSLWDYKKLIAGCHDDFRHEIIVYILDIFSELDLR